MVDWLAEAVAASGFVAMVAGLFAWTTIAQALAG